MKYLLENIVNKKLFFQKKYNKLKIINNNLIVYEIFSNFGLIQAYAVVFNIILTEKENKYFVKKRSLKKILVIIKKVSYAIFNGYFVDLLLVGLGYKAQRLKNKHFIFFELHYSHKLIYKIPKNTSIRCIKKKLVLFGLHKTDVINISEEIKSLRYPNIYKGKGIKYLNEVVTLKPGKQR
jgi:large subunit ribosomal protein L6